MSIVGTVKWFSDSKGYGFLEYDSGLEVFVHYTSLNMDGFKTLKQGEEVYFDLIESEKGLQAANVSKI